MKSFQLGPYQIDATFLKSVTVKTAVAADLNRFLAQDASIGTGCQFPVGDVSILDALKELAKEEFVGAMKLVDCKVVTKSCSHVLVGEDWSLSLMESAIQLYMKGVQPFMATYCYYGSDNCLEEPRTAHRFFVVAADRIVEEDFRLHAGSSESNPWTFFRHVEAPSEESWSGESARWHATVRDWYYQFYANTHSGRVMVFRDDRPSLHPAAAQVVATLLSHETANDESWSNDQSLRNNDPALELTSLREGFRRVEIAQWLLATVVCLLLLRQC